MKKKTLKKYLLDTFSFDMTKEKAIYSYLCKNKLTKEQKKILTPNIEYKDYKSWRSYIINKYSVYDQDSLLEFEKMLNLLIRQSKKLDSFERNTCIAYISTILSVMITQANNNIVENVWLLLILYMVFMPFFIAYIMVKLYDVYGNSEDIYLLQDIHDIISDMMDKKYPKYPYE